MTQQIQQTQITDNDLQLELLIEIEHFRKELAKYSDWEIIEELQIELETEPNEDPIELSKDVKEIFKKYHRKGQITKKERELLEATFILLITNNVYLREI